MGRYYPPSATDQPAFNSAGNLRLTQRKLPDGAQTVRFEMPFHVWCETCPQPTIVPQGVRFNAEKRKVGMYHTTPVWAFRMRHTACGGAIEIRTDPARSEYVVAEGGKRRDYGEDKSNLFEGGEILTEEERERRRNDAFAALEGKVEDKAKAEKDRDRLDELKDVSERGWSDPYEASRRLRKSFRMDRKARQKAAGQREEIVERYGLSMRLLDESDADRARAKLVEFGGKDLDVEGDGVIRKPLFTPEDAGGQNAYETDKRKTTKSERKVKRTRLELQSKLAANTRAAVDPFLVSPSQTQSPKTFLGLKRKRGDSNEEPVRMITPNSHEVKKAGNAIQPSIRGKASTYLALIDYDSD